MKKLRYAGVAALLVLVLVLAALWTPLQVFHASGTPQTDTQYHGMWMSIPEEDIVQSVSPSGMRVAGASEAMPSDEYFLLEAGKTLSVSLSVPADGDYSVALTYQRSQHMISDSSAQASLAGEEYRVSLYSIWTDNSKEYSLDRFNNEMPPTQVAEQTFHTDYLRRYSGGDKNPIVWTLPKGETEFTLQCVSQDIQIQRVELVSVRPLMSYEEYRNGISDPTIGGGLIFLEAEDYAAKSHSYIAPSSSQDPTASPYDVYTKKINIVGQSTAGSGFRLIWNFHVEQAGNYQLAFRYEQSWKEEIPSFCDVEIDGVSPFAEMVGLALPSTEENLSTVVASDRDGTPYEIWLDEGDHQLAIRHNGARSQSAVDALQDVMLAINDAGIEIKKVAGVSNDPNRVWDIEEYLPGLLGQMEEWQQELQRIYEELGSLQKENPAEAINIQLAIDILKKLAEEPEKIPARLGELNEGSGSAAQLIGDLIPLLDDQVVALDWICLSGEGIPEPDVGIWSRVSNGVKSFFYSFSEDGKGNSTITSTDDEGLEIWVKGSIAYVQEVQRLCDRSYLPDKDYDVQMSLLSDDNKLILASAAGVAPDLALGVASHLPFQFAMRGALEDLTQFEDFTEFVTENFNIHSLTPYIFQDGVYGITERQDFYVLFYRKDILEKLGLSVPETWDDVEDMMPTLRRQGMSFYIPLSSAVGLKPFYSTLPFFFQTGTELYSSDGMQTLIGSEAGAEAFQLMTDLYKIYTFNEQTASFYNDFRYGRSPIGVSGFSDYLLLRNVASEIADLWDIAPAPGVRQEDGSIKREYMGVSQSNVIFKGADLERSWDFLKWWMSGETQAEYATTMQTNYGPEFMWNTANLNAFAQLQLEDSHREVILEQWESLREPPFHPATYMLERSISNAWINTVVNGDAYRVALDEAIIATNREILRKLEEFGYVKDGQKVEDFKISTIEEILGVTQ